MLVSVSNTHTLMLLLPVGSIGWVSFERLIWLFSSNESTSAWLGGLRWKPTTSRSFSIKKRSGQQFDAADPVKL